MNLGKVSCFCYLATIFRTLKLCVLGDLRIIGITNICFSVSYPFSYPKFSLFATNQLIFILFLLMSLSIRSCSLLNIFLIKPVIIFCWFFHWETVPIDWIYPFFIFLLLFPYCLLWKFMWSLSVFFWKWPLGPNFLLNVTLRSPIFHNTLSGPCCHDSGWKFIFSRTKLSFTIPFFFFKL